MNDALKERLCELARSPILLVATDYDGTLAPIVEQPELAKPDREAMVALRNLAALSQTHVAVISGRALCDLAELTGAPEEVHLVGSHGSEFDPDFAANLDPATVELRNRVESELSEIAKRGNGFLVESKPASIAFHFRNADDEIADEAVRAVLEGPAAYEGVYTKHGKKVVELGVVSTSKGTALQTIRHRVGATAAIFIGDDVTDEDAFETLAGPDIGIKVGEGESAAELRVADTHEVSQLLAFLSEERSRWLQGADAVPIEHHSMLSDQRTVALVTPDARVTWMCAPRVDSSALFAELVGGPSAGYFAVAPADASAAGAIGQDYESDSLVLHTRFSGLTVTDYLDCSGGLPLQRAGRVELIRVLRGRGKAAVEFAPRLDFGRVATRLNEREGGLEVEGTVEPIVLYAPGVTWQITTEGNHQTARAEIDLSKGPVALELRYGTGSLAKAVVAEHERRTQTDRFWSEWASTLQVPSLRPDLIRRSALVLKGLCHAPTGAIVAAGTTSLPECIGGVRNWDYRYCWPRDAALSAEALVRLGSNGEALRFLDWMLGIVDRQEHAGVYAPLYTVAGGHLGSEAEISELSGYAGSRPVRIGNAAAHQVQLDVFGPVVELVYALLERGAPLSTEHWRLVEAMVEAVASRWREPDHGIWEVRTERRHHVHTKAMCWLTADRAAKISQQFLSRPREDFTKLADEIRADVLEHGYDERTGCFSAWYGDGGADASALTIGLLGLVGPDDERFVRTVEYIERELRQGPTVYRYHYDDGLPGTEGGFNICTTWLIESLALIGQTDRAQALFDDYVALAGPTGLLCEEWDPNTGLGLGNHPQAYSHLGLINAAQRLSGKL